MLYPQNSDIQEKDKYLSLPNDVQQKLFFETLYRYEAGVIRMISMLPSLSALSVAMLVVITLNPQLIPISARSAKLAISVLLISIPVSLFLYLHDERKAAKNAQNKAKKYMQWHGVQSPAENKSNLLDKVTSSFPMIMVAIYAGIVILVLYYMWIF